jgi:hypothetical protein
MVLCFFLQITKSISRFLAQNRAKNDASNRAEFLLSLADKKGILRGADPDSAVADPGPSCARTDAKTQNRDVQMKYDIAKNEDGPLRKTIKREHDDRPAKRDDEVVRPDGTNDTTAQRHPALDERLRNIETHTAVRYGEQVMHTINTIVIKVNNTVPSPPKSLLDRLKFLEDHIIRLEKDYPPWAALHFNQPHRGVCFTFNFFLHLD